MTSRRVRHDDFGDPDVLRLETCEIPTPNRSQLCIRVTVAGLNPVDWQIVASPQLAAAFGVAVPSGFGNDFAGVVTAVGSDVAGWRVGERVYGGARGAAVADHLIVASDDPRLHRTPDGIDDLTAGVIDIVGRTASAVADALALGPADTVLIGAAGGGVGTLLTQLAVLAGARVLGTGAATSADYLRSIGAEPVVYGSGLADRVRSMAPAGLSAAADLFGTDTAIAALELGVAPRRVVTIESDDPPPGVRPVNGSDARPGATSTLLELVRAGRLRIPIAATYRLEDFRAAIEHQRARHTRGKIAIVLD